MRPCPGFNRYGKKSIESAVILSTTRQHDTYAKLTAHVLYVCPIRMQKLSMPKSPKILGRGAFGIFPSLPTPLYPMHARPHPACLGETPPRKERLEKFTIQHLPEKM